MISSLLINCDWSSHSKVGVCQAGFITCSRRALESMRWGLLKMCEISTSAKAIEPNVDTRRPCYSTRWGVELTAMSLRLA